MITANSVVGRAPPEDTTSLKSAVKALQGNDHARWMIEKLYSFLDILDRKATTLCTVNSLLMSVNGLLVFRPPALLDPTKSVFDFYYWKFGLLPAGALAIGVSLGTVVLALRVNSMGWPFLKGVEKEPAADQFDSEVDELCRAVTERTHRMGRQWILTFVSIAATSVALLLLCIYTFCIAMPPTE